MAYGLRVINDESELLIDSEYVNPTFVQKVEFNTTPVREEAPGFYLHRNYILREYTTASITAPGNYIVLWTIPENFANNYHQDVWYSFPTSVSTGAIQFSCYVLSSIYTSVTYKLPTAYVFAVDSASVSALYSTGPALRMYNSAEAKTFDSNLTQLVPYSFSDEVNLPNSISDSTIILSSIPNNPIFLLPNSDLLLLVNRRVFFPNYSGHIESVTTTTFRRVGSTIYTKPSEVYSSQEDTTRPEDAIVFRNGSSNNLSLMVADADLYQAPGAGNVGGNTPQYQLTSNYYTVNEGATFVITLTTTLTTNGTVFPYTVTGISAADLTVGSLEGDFVIQGNSATQTFTVNNDLRLEGDESFTLNVQGLNLQVSVSILDTSRPAGVYSFGAVSPVDEGSNTGYVNFEYQYAAGKFVSFAIVAPTSGIAATSADVTLNYLAAPGLVINQSNMEAGTFAVGYNVAADTTTEGLEYFRISATVDGTTYYSGNIQINDTSLTAISYGITASNNWLESSTGNVANVTANGVNGSTLYFTTDNAVVTPQTTSVTVNSNNYSVNVSYNVGLVTATTNVTLQVRVGSASSTPVATKVVSIANANPTYSFGAVSPINEGSTGSVQFNYSNSAGVSFGFSATSPSSGEQRDGSSDVTVNTTSFTVGGTDAAGTVSVSYSVAADAQTENTEYFRIQAYINGLYYTSDDILINDTSRSRGYSISTAGTWVESTTLNTVTVNATNANGLALYLTSSDSSIAYVTAGYASSWSINSDSYSANTYYTAGNVLTSTNVTLYLRTGSASGPVVAETTLTINDTNPQFSWATSPLSLNEGTTNSLTFNFSEAAGVTFSWYIYPPTGGVLDGSADVTLLTGDYTAPNSDAAGSVNVSYSVAADQYTEGTEYFRLVAYANGGYYYSNNITINDTSQSPEYYLAVNSPPWNENTTQATTVTFINVAGRTYYPTSDNGAVTCQTSSFYVSSNSFTTTLYWNVGAVSADTTVTLYLRRNSSNGTIDAQASVTVRNILAAGTPIGGAYCLNYNVSPYTLRQVRADGSGGTYNDDINNSTTCGYVAPIARGIYHSQFCGTGANQYTLYFKYHDGNYGFYDEVHQTNSPTCGYVDPPVYAITSPLNIDESTTQGRATLLHYNIVGSKTVTISAIAPSSGANGSADVVIPTTSFTVTGYGTPTIYYYANPDSTTEGTEYFRLRAVVDGVPVATSDDISISDTSGYPAAGTPIGGAYCLNYNVAPYTLRQVRANGSGGTYNDDTNNSPTCGYVAPTPRGTYLSQYCSGYTLYYRYADGNYGYYDQVQQNNSPTCGYNPPAYGTYLSQYCSGFSLYYRYADGAYGSYDVLQANNSPSCGYVAPSYSLGGTFSSLNNGAGTGFYLYVTNPVYDNVYVSASGPGAARISAIDPGYFTTNTGTNVYFIYVYTTTPTSSVPAQSVTITVAHNNGAVSKSFSFTIPEYTVAAAAPIVTSVQVTDGTYYAGEGIAAIINFSGIITADTYINIRIDAGIFGQLYYPYNGGAAQSYTGGQYGDYVVMTVGTYSGYYAGPVNPGGFYPPIYNARINVKAVTAGGSDRQGYVQSSGFTLDGGSNDR